MLWSGGKRGKEEIGEEREDFFSISVFRCYSLFLMISELLCYVITIDMIVAVIVIVMI